MAALSPNIAIGPVTIGGVDIPTTAAGGVFTVPDDMADEVIRILQQRRGVTVTRLAWSVSILDYGARANGTAVEDAAIRAAVAAAKATIASAASTNDPDTHGHGTIYLPPGEYLVTDPGAFLGDEAMTVAADGIRFVGAGHGVTTVIYRPPSASAMCSNDYWRNVGFEGISFVADTAGCTFLESFTTHNAQRFSFLDCKWINFKYIVNLQGDNNNDSFTFFKCHALGIGSLEADKKTGAWLYIGPTTTVDQFLAFSWYDCSYWTSHSPWIYAKKGGHFNLYGCDASNFANGAAAQTYLFQLYGTSHADGVCHFAARDFRTELQSVNGGLLYSEWPSGTVLFDNVDISSKQATYTYGAAVISILYTNLPGPMYTFRECNLAGGVTVEYGVTDAFYDHRITFERCYWWQKATPTDVVTWVRTGGHANASDPPVRFLDCNVISAGNLFNATGAPVWNAVVGYRGGVLQDLQARVLSVRDAVGSLPVNADGALYFRMPLGAIVTGARVLSPAGASSEGDGGTWTVKANLDADTIATLTVGGALSAGFDVSASPATPYFCDTTNKRRLSVTATNVTNGNTGGLLMILGYW